MTGPFGDLGGRDSAVEPCRDARVPEVVYAARERRGGLGGAEGVTPGLGPRSAVGDRCQLATLDPGEDPPAGGTAEVAEMGAQKPCQWRRRRYPVGFQYTVATLDLQRYD